MFFRKETCNKTKNKAIKLSLSFGLKTVFNHILMNGEINIY